MGGDARIDEMQAQIEERALKLLALRQPERFVDAPPAAVVAAASAKSTPPTARPMPSSGNTALKIDQDDWSEF
mgnify:CR=1 FL=1